jgi:hypothetical protein
MMKKVKNSQPKLKLTEAFRMQQLAGIRSIHENLNELSPGVRGRAAKGALSKYQSATTPSGKAKSLAQYRNLMKLPGTLDRKAGMFAEQIASYMGIQDDFGYKIGKTGEGDTIRFFVYKGNNPMDMVYSLVVNADDYTEDIYVLSRGGQPTGQKGGATLPDTVARKIVRFVKELQQELTY